MIGWLVAILLLQAPGDARPWSPPEDDPDRFAPIVTLNIFNADRDRLREARERAAAPAQTPVERAPEAPPPPPPPPAETHVLVGISQHGEQVVAFVEDRTTGTVQRLQAGASIAEGVIREIHPSVVHFELEDETHTVRTGQSLRGGAPAIGATARPRPDTPDNSPEPEASSPSAEQEILRRLRERRQQESSP